MNQASTTKLTREEVIAKYGPVRDPLWTPEVEAAFFARLPPASYRHSVKLDDVRAMLVRDFGTADLKAHRMGAAYVSTLGATLGLFSEADRYGVECLVSHRDNRLGPPNIIRNIQEQMHNAGLLVKQTRAQGHGFIGSVYVYSPQERYRHRKATGGYLEQLYRGTEGENPVPPIPENLAPDDVPH